MKRIIGLILVLSLFSSVCALGQQVVADVVQPTNWWDKLPRESWSQFEKVDVSQSWFEVYKLPGDVYAIYEPGQFQEVISFLIIGADKAVLWDTGMGIGDMRKCVEELTNLPITVINSHSHMDHISGNWQFDEILIYNNEDAIKELTNGRPHESVKGQLEGDAVWMPLPEGFVAEEYETKGKAPTGTVEDGQIIDLGNRKLEVVYTPGHSSNAIMLIDAENKILFTGDTYYPAPLYAFSKDSDFATYEATMDMIAKKVEPLGLEWIYSSHNEVVKGTSILAQVAEAMHQISSGQKTDYVLDEDGLRLYTFDNNIKVITRDN